jgi:hypothetical protein
MPPVPDEALELDALELAELLCAAPPDPELDALMLVVALHTHDSNPLPSSLQVCAPVSPLGQAHETDCPGTHAFAPPAPLVAALELALLLLGPESPNVASVDEHPTMSAPSQKRRRIQRYYLNSPRGDLRAMRATRSDRVR